MSQWSDNLGSMTGRVVNARPGVSPLDVRGWINDRVRQALGSRTYWTDLIRPKIISVPDEYDTGTVSVTLASATATGVATAWPVDDLVNTDYDGDVYDVGYAEVTPTSMTGITEDSILLLDSGQPTEEIVSVVEVKPRDNPTRFIAKCQYAHTDTAAITQSSLAGRQFRISNSDPIFTIKAVNSGTSLTLNQPWGGPAKSTQAYRILKMYLTVATDLKDILTMKDESTSRPVRTHVPVNEINFRDPQRTHMNTGALITLVDLGPNEQGNMQYEMWPAPTTGRQFSCLYYAQWPDLESDMDRPPWFINPTIFIHGAIADALRAKKSDKDTFFNPALAQEFEQRFMQGLQLSVNEDESKFQRAYSWRWDKMFGPGGNDYYQSHTPESDSWDFGPSSW